MKESGLANVKGLMRIIIEKPFGDDLKSAEKLNSQMNKSFEEGEIFGIGHYLSKEMTQDTEHLRLWNIIFEPLWNNKYISNIQATSSETIGIEHHGGYYESGGTLKFMVQNHLLQMVQLLAIEPPISRKSNDIRKEKVQILEPLKCFNPSEIRESLVRGQYDGGMMSDEFVPAYRDEPNVNSQSNTETFVADKIEIENSKWAGVTFYIRTGERMKKIYPNRYRV